MSSPTQNYLPPKPQSTFSTSSDINMDENASYSKYNLSYYIVQYLTRKCIDFNNSYTCN